MTARASLRQILWDTRRLFSRIPGAPRIRTTVPLDCAHASDLAEGDRLLFSRTMDDGVISRIGRCVGTPQPTTWRDFLSAREEVVAEMTGATFARCLPIDRQRRARYEGETDISHYQGASIRTRGRELDAVAYLSNTAVPNPGHWLLDVLPLLSSYQQVRELASYPQFWTGDDPPTPGMLEGLQVLGIGRERITYGRCTVRRATVAIHSYPSSARTAQAPGYTPKSSFAWLRNALAGLRSTRTDQPRNLYVKRGNTRWRRVLNEAGVEQALCARGFHSIDLAGMSLAMQTSLFANADVIVAPHGAALGNLIFAKEGVKVVEIMPAGYDAMLWFYPLACYLDADYTCFIAQAGDGTAQAASGHSDMSVDIPALLELVG